MRFVSKCRGASDPSAALTTVAISRERLGGIVNDELRLH